MEYLIDKAIKTMPKYVAYKIEKQLATILEGRSRLSEVRLMRGGGSLILVDNTSYKLYVNVNGEELSSTLLSLCRGSLYAHRDTIARGYISFEGGIRIGVCGEARYDGESLVGIDGISTLVYRFPTSGSSLSEELYSAFSLAERGMLIYSPAGGGKTTALRSLCSLVARRGREERIAVVDERCEFPQAECERLGISLLRGYRRELGMDIALRTLTASIIAIDEIGGVDESLRIRQSLLSGVRFIATAHAKSIETLFKRDSIRPYLDMGVFDVFFGIFNTDGNYYCEVKKI